jgi:sugar fermentation stimulation protein A
MVKLGSTLVSIDSRVPGVAFSEAVRAGSIKAFAGYRTIRPEVRYGESRLDFLLTGDGPPFLVEVKSVTLVVDGQARFPDAPTPRGARHLHELARAVSEGYRAAVVFVIQREDVSSFAPNDSTDPEFGEALRQAALAGVEVYPLRCLVTPDRVEIMGEVAEQLQGSGRD